MPAGLAVSRRQSAPGHPRSPVSDTYVETWPAVELRQEEWVRLANIPKTIPLTLRMVCARL